MKFLNTGFAALIGSVVLSLVACGCGGSGSAASSVNSTPTPTLATWSVTGSLQTARYGHTATLLPNGKVLVIGGASLRGSNQPGDPIIFTYLPNVEQYDPATKAWTTMGTLNTARYGHTATLLPNNKVLVVGGWGDASMSSNDVELYDTASNTAVAGPSSGTTHSSHTATLLPNGKVLVVGGRANDQSTNKIEYKSELYDPVTNTWAAGGTMTQMRDNHFANLLPNGKVLVVGGFGNTSQNPGAELYDPATNTWTAVASPSSIRWSTSTVLPNGKVLLIPWLPFAATNSTALYDPASNAWALTASITTSDDGHTATLLPNGRVLMVGGGDYSVKSGSTYGSDVARLYDPAANTWSPADKLILGPRTGHTATLLPNGAVLVVGGAESVAAGARAEAALYGP